MIYKIIVVIILWLIIVPLMGYLKNRYYNYKEPRDKEKWNDD